MLTNYLKSLIHTSSQGRIQKISKGGAIRNQEAPIIPPVGGPIFPLVGPPPKKKTASIDAYLAVQATSQHE